METTEVPQQQKIAANRLVTRPLRREGGIEAAESRERSFTTINRETVSHFCIHYDRVNIVILDTRSYLLILCGPVRP